MVVVSGVRLLDLIPNHEFVCHVCLALSCLFDGASNEMRRVRPAQGLRVEVDFAFICLRRFVCCVCKVQMLFFKFPLYYAARNHVVVGAENVLLLLCVD